MKAIVQNQDSNLKAKPKTLSEPGENDTEKRPSADARRPARSTSRFGRAASSTSLVSEEGLPGIEGAVSDIVTGELKD